MDMILQKRLNRLNLLSNEFLTEVDMVLRTDIHMRLFVCIIIYDKTIVLNFSFHL